jgi:hypothetical protein
MRRPVSALEAAVAALEPIVEETWPVAVLEAAVAVLEPVVEEIEPVGMQPCLPLHCHRPQHCDQVVN